MKRKYTHLAPIIFSLLLSFGSTIPLKAQDKDPKPKLTGEAKQARTYALGMLDEMEENLREYYYDPKFHGMELKSRIEAAKTRVKTLEFNWQMYRVLVQVLMELNDSHTKMILPPRSDYFHYGLGWQMIGDECFVTSIEKDSNAFKQGIATGDQILMIGKFQPNRNDLWKINYVINKLDPNKTLDLKIKTPEGTERAVTIEAKTMTEKEFRAEIKRKADKEKEKEKEKGKDKDKDTDESFKCEEINKDLAACKLFSFSVDKKDIDKMMRFASKYPKLILDLRGNGGGYVAIEQYLLSFFFDHEVKIADLIEKDKTETRTTKVLDASKQYKGEVIALVDSHSASASEMTARVLQLEKRALIYGDYTSGSVMTSIRLPFRSVMSLLAEAALVSVSMTVTVGDVIMRDGSRLEHRGVVPDQILQPSGIALQKRWDAALAYAAVKFGAAMSPEDAGKLYFFMEKEEDNDEDGKPN